MLDGKELSYLRERMAYAEIAVNQLSRLVDTADARVAAIDRRIAELLAERDRVIAEATDARERLPAVTKRRDQMKRQVELLESSPLVDRLLRVARQAARLEKQVMKVRRKVQ